MSSTPSTVSFVVPGKPHAKMRPWATATRGRTHVFTPQPTVAYEAVVRAAARAALKGAPPLSGAVSAHVRVRLVPPKRPSRAVRASMIAGAIAPTKRPDLDNVVKAILDGANGVAIEDDANIVRLSAEKIYAETPGVDVRFAKLDGGARGEG